MERLLGGGSAAPASAPAGQESLFASRLKTATEKQSSGLPIDPPGSQADNASDNEQVSATDHVERTEGQKKTATPEMNLNGSAGAALLQPATVPNAEVTIVVHTCSIRWKSLRPPEERGDQPIRLSRNRAPTCCGGLEGRTNTHRR